MKKTLTILLLLCCMLPSLRSQINAEHMLRVGQNALYFEDYVLSIQYFNQAIKNKPHLAEPYFYRAVAKLYLGDYEGCEEDCSLTLERNAFMAKAYLCRSYARMKLNKFELVVADCEKGLEFDSQNKDLMKNRAYAFVYSKQYKQAETALDNLSKKYPMDVDVYLALGKMHVEMTDTMAAIEDFSRAISVDKYNSLGWGARGWIYLMKDKHANALADLNEAIGLRSDDPAYFMNRALARYHLNDLRGTMDDFDQAINLDPENKLNYLNRAILRTTVGDLNRAVDDYNKVISLDPDDYQIVYNRALVLKDLGKYKDAIADFSRIITKYPEFLPAYQLRSESRRLSGDLKGADKDYFAAWNLQEKLRKERNKQPVAANNKQVQDSVAIKQESLKKLQRMVAVQSNLQEENQYDNSIRGSVQNTMTDFELAPMYKLTYYEPKQHGLNKRGIDLVAYLKGVNLINNKKVPSLLLANQDVSLTSKQADIHFESINEYSKLIDQNQKDAGLYFGRSLDYFLVQDLNNALLDVGKAIEHNPAFVLAYFERSYLRYRKMNIEYAKNQQEKVSVLNEVASDNAPSKLNLGEKAYGMDLDLLMRDLEKILELDPDFFFAYYNRGCIRFLLKDYRNAIVDFSKVISKNPEFADAWFNRGITYIFLGDREKGVSDLRMAGQLGNYKAYNLLKRLSGE
jgi:tetratricopeptide (TPR) repeat protein